MVYLDYISLKIKTILVGNPRYLRDGSAQTLVCASTRRQPLQTNLAISPSPRILDTGQTSATTDPTTPDAWQGIATRIPVTGMTPPENVRTNPRLSCSLDGHLTTKPPRRQPSIMVDMINMVNMVDHHGYDQPPTLINMVTMVNHHDSY